MNYTSEDLLPVTVTSRCIFEQLPTLESNNKVIRIWDSYGVKLNVHNRRIEVNVCASFALINEEVSGAYETAVSFDTFILPMSVKWERGCTKLIYVIKIVAVGITCLSASLMYVGYTVNYVNKKLLICNIIMSMNGHLYHMHTLVQ